MERNRRNFNETKKKRVDGRKSSHLGCSFIIRSILRINYRCFHDSFNDERKNRCLFVREQTTCVIGAKLRTLGERGPSRPANSCLLLSNRLPIDWSGRPLLPNFEMKSSLHQRSITNVKASNENSIRKARIASFTQLLRQVLVIRNFLLVIKRNRLKYMLARLKVKTRIFVHTAVLFHWVISH